VIESLDAVEARVIGCLMEKEVTTPDQYPLSLNALVNACNQKTNRDPVLELDEATVQQAVDRLSKRHLVMDRSGFGSRVVKYRHRLCNGEHNPRQFSPQEFALICELLVRGAQTPGELRGRGQRMAPFADVGVVEAALKTLATRSDGPYVAQMPRLPGAREARWRTLFAPEPTAASAPAAAVPAPAAGGLEARVSALEQEVQAMRAELARLRESR
jgi:uncharacterized protein YceH (UPF0502 family)